MLASFWRVLTKEQADRFAEAQDVAHALLAHAYKVIGVKNISTEQSALSFVQEQSTG